MKNSAALIASIIALICASLALFTAIKYSAAQYEQGYIQGQIDCEKEKLKIDSTILMQTNFQLWMPQK